MNIAVGVDLIVAGDVIAPVIVAALVSGNAAVAVINARERARNRERAVDLLECSVAMPTKLIDP